MAGRGIDSTAAAWRGPSVRQRRYARMRKRLAIPTESQNTERLPDLYRYLNEEIGPALSELGFAWRILPSWLA